jgi:hypothetical protein
MVHDARVIFDVARAFVRRNAVELHGSKEVWLGRGPGVGIPPLPKIWPTASCRRWAKRGL